MKAVKTWPVNEDGHVILTTGSGSATVHGYVLEDFIPVDEDGRMPVVFDVSPSGSGGTVTSNDITDASSTGKSVLTGTASVGRTALGLGTAATQASSAFATAAQGTLADNAQPKIGVPSAFTSRALTDADDGATLVCSTAQTATINTGLAGFNGAVFDGAISFDGTATVTDSRSSGATVITCVVYRIGTDSYRVVGGKA